VSAGATEPQKDGAS